MRSILPAVVAVALLSGGPAAVAQPPEPRPLAPTITTVPLDPPVKMPAGPVEDPDVLPAQYTAGPTGGGAAAAPYGFVPRPVADPPTPAVRIQVRVPADVPPGDDLKYVITVRNTSAADAHRVQVRNPMVEGILQKMKAEPLEDQPKGTGPVTPLAPATQAVRELVWSFGTLKPGESKTIELVLRPKPDAGEVRNFAYVRFEHGEAVTTKVRKPAVKVTKSAPKSVLRDQPYNVRVVVENTGKVPTADLRLTENVPAAAEVEAVTTGGERAKDRPQWVWPVGSLLPGQRKVFEYRLTPRQVPEAVTTSNVATAGTPAGKAVLETAESRTAVLVAGLSVKLRQVSPDGIVGPGETARYEITVKNSGTVPTTNVRVSGTLPADCKPTMKTDGGQVYRDQIVWTVPKLDPDEAHTFRFALRAATTGKRNVAAAASDARGTKAQNDLVTVFQAAAALVWETVPEPSSLAVGRRGTLTVRVRNNGGEAAKNVRLEVELPDVVRMVEATPKQTPGGRRVSFPAEGVPAGSERTYTITYEATHPAQAYFRMWLTADSLGDKPLETQKSVEITGGG